MSESLSSLFDLKCKWENLISNLIKKKKGFIPEIDVRSFLKENYSQFSEDFWQVRKNFKGQLRIGSIVKHLIDFAISNLPKETCGATNPIEPKPNLDYYDNKIDRFKNRDLVKHQAVFGKSRKDDE